MIENQEQGLFINLRHRYQDLVERQRAYILLRVNMVLAVAWIVVMVVAVVPPLFLRGTFSALSLVFLLLPIPLIGALVLLQRGHLQLATWLYVGMLSSSVIPVIISIEFPAAPMLLILPLTAAGVFLGRRGLLIVVAVLALAIGVRVIVQSQYARTIRINTAETIPRDLALVGTSLGMSAVFLFFAMGGNQRVMRANQRDMELLQKLAEFRQRLGTNPTENDIFLNVLVMLQVDLGYTVAQLFVQDELGSFTRLRLAGTDLMSRNKLNRLNVSLADDPSAVGESARLMQPVSASLNDAPLRSSHLVPPAQAGIALPLISNGVLLGVLDIQTTTPDTLSDARQDALDGLASQVAGALADVRNVAELQRTTREQEETINRYRAQVFEMQQRTQQLMTSGWERYIQGRGGEAFGFDVSAVNGRGLTTTPAADLPDDIRRALEQGDIHVEPRDGHYVVNAPISYRGEVLGAMTFTLSQPLTERQIDLLRTVSIRLGLALENNRLYEQSQAQAAREHKAGEIASRLITATDIQSVLSLAAESFNEALGAVHTRVYLEPFAASDDEVVSGSRNGALS
jgi:GAF domain-containing protein